MAISSVGSYTNSYENLYHIIIRQAHEILIYRKNCRTWLIRIHINSPSILLQILNDILLVQYNPLYFPLHSFLNFCI